jgi:hypothetical protein
MPPKRTRLQIRNSGFEVWLYDDANRAAIRRPTAKDKGFAIQTRLKRSGGAP